MSRWDRITVNPDQMGGRPCIRGIRIPVSRIITMLAEGMSNAEILDDYPDLEEADIVQSLQYAAAELHERQIPFQKKHA